MMNKKEERKKTFCAFAVVEERRMECNGIYKGGRAQKETRRWRFFSSFSSVRLACNSIHQQGPQCHPHTHTYKHVQETEGIVKKKRSSNTKTGVSCL